MVGFADISYNPADYTGMMSQGLDPQPAQVPAMGQAYPSAPSSRPTVTPATSGIFGIIDSAAQQYGVDPLAMRSIAYLESSFNPSAQNPNSSAGGLFQQIDSNARAYGVENRMDPAQSAAGAARFARENMATLRNVLGREPTVGELYLAHQQGPGGASRLLRNPNARAVDIVGADAVRLNGGNTNMTAREFANIWISKAEDAAVRLSDGSYTPPEYAGGAGDPAMVGQQANDTLAPTFAPAQVQSVYDAYASGSMTPQDRARYAEGVRSGAIPLPQGVDAASITPPPTVATIDPNIAANVYNAAISGQMPAADQARYWSGVNSGAIPLPDGAEVPTNWRDPLAPDVGPAIEGPTRQRDSIRSGMGNDSLQMAGQMAASALGLGPNSTPSVAAQMLPEGTPDWLRDLTGPTLDLVGAPLMAAQGIFEKGAGTAGDIAVALGQSPTQGAQLANDLAAIPDAFAGSPQGLMRAQTRPDLPARTAAPNPIEQAGAANDIRVMTSDVRQPNTFASRWLQTVGERVPIAGTGPVREAQFAERQAAIENLVRDYNPTGVSVDEILPRITDDLIATRSARIGELTDQKNAILQSVNDAGPVDVSQTVAAIDSQIADLSRLNTQQVQPVIDVLEDFKTAINGADGTGQSLAEIEVLRRQLGEVFNGDSMASVRDAGQKALRGIYDPLRTDIGDFVEATAGRPARNEWEVTNRQLSEMAGELNVTALRSVLSRGDATPEVVRTMLFSNKASDVQQLVDGLSPTGLNNARAAILSEAMERASTQGEISPARFLSQMERLGRQVGIAFDASDQAITDGLLQVLHATRRADTAALSPTTGVQNNMFIGGAVLTDLMGGFGAATASAGSIGMVARAYESRPMRNMLTRISQTEAGSPEQMRLIQQFNTLVVSGAIVAPNAQEQE